jgi:hypothetical protein
MSRTPRLIGILAAALLAPAAGASAATFTGTTDQGVPISFEADGDHVSHVVSLLTMVCTGRSGIEPYQPSGTFVADGTESKLTELRPSAVLNRDATQSFTFTGTIDGSRASGTIALSYATTDFDLFTMQTRITVCDGSAAFTAAAPSPPAVVPSHQAGDPTPVGQPKKQQPKKKKKGKKKGAGKQRA